MSTNTISTQTPQADTATGDYFRQFAVIVVTLATIAINGLATGLPLNGQSTGDISDRFPSLFTPAGYVFSIWGVIYLGLLAYMVYQALPAQRTNPRLRSIALLPQSYRQYRKQVWQAGACSSIAKENMEQEWFSSVLCIMHRAMQREAKLRAQYLGLTEANSEKAASACCTAA